MGMEYWRRLTWKPEKSIISIAIYLAYGHFEFAYLLLDELIKEKFIDENDSKVNIIQDLICRRSGWKKTISISRLGKLKKVLGLTLNEGLDQ